MKKTKIITTALSLATILTVAGCGGDKTVESLTIESGLDYMYVTKSDYSFEDIKVKVKWNDGSVTYVGQKDLEISPFSTETAGKKKVTFSYKGKKIEVELKVTNNADEVYQVDFFGTPRNLSNRTGNLAVDSASDTGYNLKDSIYVVGDDNDFQFRPVIKLLDPETQVATTYDDYTSASTLYIDTNPGAETNFVELNDANSDVNLKLSKYVSNIDEENSSYDFTEAAIDQTFKLVVKPKYFPIAPDGSEHKQELVFKVVDGYNVDEADELGIMTNYNDPYESENPVSIDNAAVMTEFLISRGILKEGEQIPNVKGIVLHDNIQIKSSDLPSQYFVIDEETGENYGLQDWLDIYPHYVNPGEKFNFYGNYFTIDTSALPLVAPKDKTGSGDAYSHTQLFKIRSSSVDYNATDSNKSISNFENVGFIGNSPNVSADDENITYDAADGLRGLMLYRVEFHEINMNNMWMRDFYVGGKAVGSGTVLNLNNYKSTNAYQDHLFVWGENYYNRGQTADIPGVVVNIKNSVLKNAGGPAIMAQHAVENNDTQDTAYPVINVDSSSRIDTKLYGREAWFVSVPFAAQSFPTIKIIVENMQNQTNEAVEDSSSFVLTDKGTKYINIHTITMNGADVSTGYNKDSGLNGVVNIENTMPQSLKDTYNNIIIPASAFANMGHNSLAVLTSSKGGVIMVTDLNINEEKVDFRSLDKDNESLEKELEEKFAGAEYVNLYYMGLMITLKAF